MNVFEVFGRLELNDELLPSWLPGFLRDSFFSDAAKVQKTRDFAGSVQVGLTKEKDKKKRGAPFSEGAPREAKAPDIPGLCPTDTGCTRHTRDPASPP